MDFEYAVEFFVSTALDFVLDMVLPMLAAAVGFFLTAATRKRRLAAVGWKSGRVRETTLFAFVLFCTGLAALTVTPPNFLSALRDGVVPILAPPFSGGVNLIPKVFSPSYWDGLWGLFMNLANIGMFAPLGLFPALLWDRPSWRRAVLVGGGASLLIEMLQRFVGRATDVDDLILNTVGALCGYWFYLLLRRLAPRALSKFRCERQEIANGPERGDPPAHS